MVTKVIQVTRLTEVTDVTVVTIVTKVTQIKRVTFNTRVYNYFSGGYRGLQWFQLKPLLKERAPLTRDDWYREEQKSP